MKGIVPEQILNRKDKIGWNAPNDIWFNKKLKNDLITKYGNPSTSFLNKIKDLYFYKDTFSKNQRVFLDYYKKIHKNVMS
jgi:hypothetical protein